jgi:hypothetical protein
VRTRSWAFLLPLLAGCIPYGYPAVAVTPAVRVGEQPDGIYPFRVDITTEHVDIGESAAYTLSHLPLTPAGRVPSQTECSLDHGMLVLGIALNYQVHYSHKMLVRLYRPGYQLVEIKPGMRPVKVVWKEASDLAAQEQAVDALLFTAAPRLGAAGSFAASDLSKGKGAEPCGFGGLKVGSVAAKHREALQFAASEYARLASTPSGDEKGSRRLAAKADWLRDWAQK